MLQSTLYFVPLIFAIVAITVISFGIWLHHTGGLAAEAKSKSNVWQPSHKSTLTHQLRLLPHRGNGYIEYQFVDESRDRNISNIKKIYVYEALREAH